ncbi:DNA-binding IscR family transcriptional regulator [Rossellomorea marisflavi]
MINTRLSVAIHIMSLVAMDPKQSSDQIAQSVTTNPVVIRRLSGDLKKSRTIDVPSRSTRLQPDTRPQGHYLA